MLDIRDFYKGKRVLITGHTGFKGSWMSELLLGCEASVTGYALRGEAGSLFEILGLDKTDNLNNVYADIRDIASLSAAFEKYKPEIVIHMAAQPIVRTSYKEPVYTYETNVMGTVNVLECIRNSSCVKSFVNVTTDKVYKNYERDEGYTEDEYLCGYDPYSNSKSCSELVTDSYRNSFLNDKGVAVSTIRAGNVVGGGDYAPERIIPDCVRAATSGKDIIVRNPASVRPYQHVLEPIVMYLYIAAMQYMNKDYAGAYNIGPDETDAITTGEMATAFCNEWNRISDKKVGWINKSDGGPHEATYLKLNCDKAKATFDWNPLWHIDDTMVRIVEWYSACDCGADMVEVTREQIREYLEAFYE